MKKINQKTRKVNLNKSNLHPEAVTSKALTASGITLISLVVTIIVLLILAGVVLRLITGSDGILGRATNAADRNKIAGIQEDVELAVAQMQSEYYEAKYIDRKTSGTFPEYAINQMSGTGYTTPKGATLTISGTTVTYTDKKGDTATGTFDTTTGAITINGKLASSSNLQERINSVVKEKKSSNKYMTLRKNYMEVIRDTVYPLYSEYVEKNQDSMTSEEKQEALTNKEKLGKVVENFDWGDYGLDWEHSKQKVISDFYNQNLLKDEDVELLKKQDIIEINGETIDFSKLANCSEGLYYDGYRLLPFLYGKNETTNRYEDNYDFRGYSFMKQNNDFFYRIRDVQPITDDDYVRFEQVRDTKYDFGIPGTIDITTYLSESKSWESEVEDLDINGDFQGNAEYTGEPNSGKIYNLTYNPEYFSYTFCHREIDILNDVVDMYVNRVRQFGWNKSYEEEFNNIAEQLVNRLCSLGYTTSSSLDDEIEDIKNGRDEKTKNLLEKLDVDIEMFYKIYNGDYDDSEDEELDETEIDWNLVTIIYNNKVYKGENCLIEFLEDYLNVETPDEVFSTLKAQNE